MKIAIVIILALLVILDLIFLIRTQKPKPDGLLNIDKRDPEKDYWDFVLLIEPEQAEKKKNLTIEVHVKS